MDEMKRNEKKRDQGEKLDKAIVSQFLIFSFFLKRRGRETRERERERERERREKRDERRESDRLESETKQERCHSNVLIGQFPTLSNFFF